MFVKKLPPGCTVFGKRLVSYAEDTTKKTDRISLSFSDGTTASCDVLVGADGLKSVVREFLFKDTGVSSEIVYTRKHGLSS